MGILSELHPMHILETICGNSLRKSNLKDCKMQNALYVAIFLSLVTSSIQRSPVPECWEAFRNRTEDDPENFNLSREKCCYKSRPVPCPETTTVMQWTLPTGWDEWK